MLIVLGRGQGSEACFRMRQQQGVFAPQSIRAEVFDRELQRGLVHSLCAADDEARRWLVRHAHAGLCQPGQTVPALSGSAQAQTVRRGCAVIPEQADFSTEGRTDGRHGQHLAECVGTRGRWDGEDS